MFFYVNIYLIKSNSNWMFLSYLRVLFSSIIMSSCSMICNISQEVRIFASVWILNCYLFSVGSKISLIGVTKPFLFLLNAFNVCKLTFGLRAFLKINFSSWNVLTEFKLLWCSLIWHVFLVISALKILCIWETFPALLGHFISIYSYQ